MNTFSIPGYKFGIEFECFGDYIPYNQLVFFENIGLDGSIDPDFSNKYNKRRTKKRGVRRLGWFCNTLEYKTGILDSIDIEFLAHDLKKIHEKCSVNYSCGIHVNVSR